MRKVIYQLLQEAGTEIPVERIYQFGAVEDSPEKPFVLYKFAGKTDTITSKRADGVVRVEVWIHDAPGSYSLIERNLKRVEDTFLAAVHRVVGAERISQIGYDSRSPDLYDEGFKTICKMSSFTTVGRG